MAPLPFRLRYSLAAPAAEVWPLLSNTERLNRSLRLPQVDSKCAPDLAEVCRRRARARQLGVLLEYEEEPFEWIENERHHVVRRFRSGPFRSITGGVTLSGSPAGCDALIWADFEPAWPVARAMFPLLARKLRRDWDRFAAGIREYLAGRAASAHGPGVERTDAAARERVRQALGSAPGSVAAEPLAARLFDLLAEAGDLDLECIRPFRLARQWDAAPYDVLRLCLRAAHEGVLDLSWDLVCPNCRGSEFRARSLDQLRGQAHCESCHIRYDAEFDRFVEATFRPNPRYRQIEVRTYCLAGPGNTPHIVAQLVLAAGEERTLGLTLGEGEYRLRTLTGRLSGRLVVRGNDPAESTPRLRVQVDAESLSIDSPGPLPPGPIEFELASRRQDPVQLVVERMAWDVDRATAAAVGVFQEFRDLFGAEALAPDVQLSIESLPILFTDLKGSTAMYERLGDAAAYAVVRDHFGFLQAAVAARGGGIIKTIGDSIMAAFPDIAAAVACALTVQRGVEEFNSRVDGAAIRIKMGLHRGPCLAVRANDRLDYFGSTVNMAARLHEQSRGGDIVLSAAVYRDPAAPPLLEGCRLTPFTTALRGMAEEQQLWRVEP